ncbi:hypothetical protein [Candidatus Leptofilum sp.]|uniref:hypothetical protein n=1 Tax=Candidatus Leptofilum sp. TaxID=3241576 RepID=UPI003B5C4AB4
MFIRFLYGCVHLEVASFLEEPKRRCILSWLQFLPVVTAELGISEEALHNVLDEPGQGLPDLEAAAQQLTVPVEALQTALGVPNGERP